MHRRIPAGGSRSTPRTSSRIPVDAFVPAALENQLTNERAIDMECQVVIEAANGPTTAAGEEVLTSKGVEIIPDILANAGGVVVSYFEWLQNQSGRSWRVDDVGTRLREIIWDANDKVVAMKAQLDCSPPGCRLRRLAASPLRRL